MKPWNHVIEKLGALMLAAVMASPMAAWAQNYPERPIRIVAATTPGSPADLLARLMAEAMAKVMNATFVVENKPGADQVLGFEFVAKSAPADGYTVLLAGIDGMALLPVTKKELRFNPLQDLTLVAGVGEVRYVLMGPASEPHRNFKELVDAINAAPGKYSYGASGPAVRIPAQLMMNRLGLDMQYVPYKGGAATAIDIAAGRIHWSVTSESTAHTVKERVRLYGITGTGRSAANPDVPTFTELGLPMIQGPVYGLAVRAGTPKEMADKLSAAAALALQSTEIRSKAQAALLELKYDNAEATQRTLNDRWRGYQDAARSIGLQAE